LQYITLGLEGTSMDERKVNGRKDCRVPGIGPVCAAREDLTVQVGWALLFIPTIWRLNGLTCQ